MQQFIDKYQRQIRGVLSGFDRLVFRGSLRRLNYGPWNQGLQAMVASGMEQYLWQNQILFKDYARHVKEVSERVKQASLSQHKEQGLPIIFLRSPRADKEALARQIAAQNKIRQGPVCAISSLEPSPTFEHRATHIIRRERPCHVLYHYQIDPQLGWMHARIQTWFPFHIQIAVNGRHWLAQQMKNEQLRFRQQDNCLVWVADYQRAQELLAQQLKTAWGELLDGFAAQLNPLHQSIFAQYPASYYWTCFQSEWATDIVFRHGDFLRRLMPLLVRHGLLSFSSSDVLRYFSKKVNRSGEIPAGFNGRLQTDLRTYREGERVKYRLNGNSTKFYDKAYTSWGSVLRGAETTINSVRDFRAYRPKEGGSPEDLQWRPLRKGIADLHRRAEISQKANERLLDALASVDDSASVEELTARVQKPARWKGRRLRALHPWAEDFSLLVALQRGDSLIAGFRNRDLRAVLYPQPASKTEQRRQSARISRQLRLLCAHGLIQRVQHTHRYHVTASARLTLLAVLTTARTSLHQLNQLQPAA